MEYAISIYKKIQLFGTEYTVLPKLVQSSINNFFWEKIIPHVVCKKAKKFL